MSKKTREGAASIFVVIFTTLLLGVITLSFVRIMISEANQTINYDLSQSAYDSALAGVEDAKIALLKYHECLNQGSTTVTCADAIEAMTEENSTENCDIISKVLQRPHVPGQETIIQSEISTGNGDPNSTIVNMEQAYTCVKIARDTDDYLGRLNSNYRTKIIPIRTSAKDLEELNYIELKWYNTDDNNRLAGSYDEMGSGSLPVLEGNKLGYGRSADFANSSRFGQRSSAPPTIQVQLIQAAGVFSLEQFELNGIPGEGHSTNQGTLMLRPSSSDKAVDRIRSNSSNGLAASADKSLNNPIDVKCDKNSTYWCSVKIEIPKPIPTRDAAGNVTTKRNEATTFIRLALPYTVPDTSFSVELLNCKEGEPSCTTLQFAGVQARVDSTGRANDLFRRVESRIELVDTYFPYPEFTANLNGEGDDTIWKNYWVTRNCWMTGPNLGKEGQPCDNSGVVGDSDRF